MSNYEVGIKILDMIIEDLNKPKSSKGSVEEPYREESYREGSYSEGSYDEGPYGEYILQDVMDGSTIEIKCPKDAPTDINTLITSGSFNKLKCTLKQNEIVFEFDGEELEELEKIGGGSYGDVYTYKYRDKDGNDKIVAIKHIKIFETNENGTPLYDDKLNLKYISDHHNEASIIKELNNSCVQNQECLFLCDIIPAHVIEKEEIDYEDEPGVNKMRDYEYIAMEIMDDNLKKYFYEISPHRGTDNSVNTNDELLKLIFKVCMYTLEILECLSSKGYYYTDLKLSNILYRCKDPENIYIRIGDLGGLFNEDDILQRNYVRTFKDWGGAKKEWKLYSTDSKTNLSYLHNYQVGILLISILERSYRLSFNNVEGEKLSAYFREDNSDEKIKQDIDDFFQRWKTVYPAGVSSHPTEEFLEILKEILYKTILTGNDQERRFSSEREFIEYLQNIRLEE